MVHFQINITGNAHDISNTLSEIFDRQDLWQNAKRSLNCSIFIGMILKFAERFNNLRSLTGLNNNQKLLSLLTQNQPSATLTSDIRDSKELLIAIKKHKFVELTHFKVSAVQERMNYTNDRDKISRLLVKKFFHKRFADKQNPFPENKNYGIRPIFHQVLVKNCNHNLQRVHQKSLIFTENKKCNTAKQREQKIHTISSELRS